MNDRANVHKYLMVANKDERSRILVMPSDKPRGNECQLENMKCNLNMEKLFFLL